MSIRKIPPNSHESQQPLLFRTLQSRLKYLSISKNKFCSIGRWLSASG